MARLKLKLKTANADVEEGERDYMLKLMEALTPTPSNWSHNTDVCTWTGVGCKYNSVTRIEISSMSLKGTLPSGLNDSLTSLTEIHLSNSLLSGPLPSLANLRWLQDVDFSYNNFTSIPDGCFQGLIGLQALRLSNNVNLQPWKFPTELNDSSALAALDLSSTNLMGFFPDIFHFFPNLHGVYLSNNSLTGVLPKSFARSKITDLGQSYNKLSGTIQVLSSMNQLSSVALQGNRFEGPIPDLSNCSDLKLLYLEDNQLTGVVPPSLMNLSRLELVYLENNWLQGPLPVFNHSVQVSLGFNTSNSFCLSHVGPCDQRVNILLEIAAAFGYPLLFARSWRGNNPCNNWSFITCDGSNIITLNLTNLNLTGTISPAFDNLTSLQKLYLGGNHLQGLIPESLATLPQLQVLDVSNNNLSGNIPRFSHKVKFIATGGVSHKSDVYSYGMLILEVVGGLKNFDKGGSSTNEMYFPDWIYKDIEQGNILSRYMINTEEENEIILKIIFVGLSCIQQNPSDRPSISKVLDMLEGPFQLLSCPPKPILCSLERSLPFSNISNSSIHEHFQQ